jgi:ribosomal protein S18 acetylase RimI-like enzyme
MASWSSARPTCARRWSARSPPGCPRSSTSSPTPTSSIPAGPTWRRADLGAEAEAIVALQRAAYRGEAELLGTDALPPLHETAAELRACGEELWVAGTPPQAAVGLEPEGDALRIARLMVAPSAQRRGLGRAAVALAMKRAAGAPLVVSTGAANTPALALYERAGFVRVGERTVPGDVRIVDLRRA